MSSAHAAHANALNVIAYCATIGIEELPAQEQGQPHCPPRGGTGDTAASIRRLNLRPPSIPRSSTAAHRTCDRHPSLGVRPQPTEPHPMPPFALPPSLSPVLRPYQSRTVLALLRGVEAFPGETLTVMFPRQSGKNEVSAVVVGALLLLHARTGGSVIVCAPTLTPQARISFDRTRRYLDSLARHLPSVARPVVAGDGILAVGRATATFLSASPLAHVAGHTASIALVADEAQDIDADWFDRQFRPMAASTGAPTLMFGTAWDGATLLERAVDRNRRLDRQRPGPVARHHQVGWREVSRTQPAYRRYVEQERDRLGADHHLFLTQYELVASRAAGRLLSGLQLAAIEGAHPRLRLPVPGERYVAGLDIGDDRPGADATVLTIARLVEGQVEVVEHVAWQSAQFAEVTAAVEGLARRWRLERLCVDATGLGGPLAAILESALGPHRVERFAFTAQSKSELGYAHIAAANTSTLSLYADDSSPESRACRLELRECRAATRGHARLDWGNPAGHDDYVASLALCLRAAASAGPSRIATGRPRP
ncbi:MAG: hypothetical protein ACSLFM_06905, partial [Tepidiformaceae bacterium]